MERTKPVFVTHNTLFINLKRFCGIFAAATEEQAGLIPPGQNCVRAHDGWECPRAVSCGLVSEMLICDQNETGRKDLET